MALNAGDKAVVRKGYSDWFDDQRWAVIKFEEGTMMVVVAEAVKVTFNRGGEIKDVVTVKQEGGNGVLGFIPEQFLKKC